jgi:hypothetical protein
MTAAALAAKLGEPDFKRQEESAQIWQYRGEACVLDVFLYQDAGELKVVHAVSRSRADLSQPQDRCDPSAPRAAG